MRNFMEWDPHETLSFQDHILLIYIQCILEFCSFGIDFEQDFELKIFANKHKLPWQNIIGHFNLKNY